MCCACGKLSLRQEVSQPYTRTAGVRRVPPTIPVPSHHGRPAQRGTAMELHLMEEEAEDGVTGWSLEEYVTHKIRHERCSLSEEKE